MSEIRVVQPHTTTVDDAIQRISAFESLLQKYRVKAVWKGSSAQIKGTGVSGSIDVSPREATVKVKLGMLARAAGVDPKKLEASIRKRLKSALEG